MALRASLRGHFSFLLRILHGFILDLYLPGAKVDQLLDAGTVSTVLLLSRWHSFVPIVGVILCATQMLDCQAGPTLCSDYQH